MLQVRKLSQAGLLQLMEQELVAHDNVELQIAPIILKLTASGNEDDFRTEAITVSHTLYFFVGL